MVAPPGAVEHFSGYPIIDPATINPELDWPGIENAQADWLDGKVQHVVANDAELAVRFSGLPSTDQRLVGVLSDRSLRWWSGTGWIVIAKGGSLTPRAAYDAGWRQNDGSAIGIGNGTETYRWNRVGVNVFVSGFIVRGTTTQFGGANTTYLWNLPVTPRDYRSVSGTGLVGASGAEYPCVLRGVGSTAVALVLTHNQRRVGNTVTGASMPVWATGDAIQFDVTYEGVA